MRWAEDGVILQTHTPRGSWGCRLFSSLLESKGSWHLGRRGPQRPTEEGTEELEKGGDLPKTAKRAQDRTEDPPLCPMTCFHYAKYLWLFKGREGNIWTVGPPTTVKLQNTET